MVDTSPATNTLYVNNLNQSVKIKDMKESLDVVFSVYGTVLQVYMRKALKMRGQAFIVYERPEDAAAAMSALQGHMLCERPMVWMYGRID